MPAPDVTICIPAYQAEAFIARTLDCARRQTYANVRILVSVDAGTDATEAICRSLAREDSRIEIIAQRERLGWSANATAIMRRVDTEFFFLYFHDDLIEPTYTEALRSALRDRPDAASAHSDLEWYGNKNGFGPGQLYDGPAVRRLAEYLTTPNRGVQLRSLVRTALASDLQFPEIASNGFWRSFPFMLQLLRVGPAIHVAQTLYRRWVRDGRMTETWQARSVEAAQEGLGSCAALGRAIVDDAAQSSTERKLLRFCLYVFLMGWMRREELRLKAETLVAPETILPLFAGIAPPKHDDPHLLRLALAAYGDLLMLEGRHAAENHDPSALAKLAAAVALNPGSEAAITALARTLEADGEAAIARALRQRLRLDADDGAASAEAIDDRNVPSDDDRADRRIAAGPSPTVA